MANNSETLMHIFLKSKKNLDEESERLRREDFARNNIKLMNKYKSISSQEYYVKMLYHFLDFDFVKKALITCYHESKFESIKSLIKSFHSGEYDCTEFKEREYDLLEIFRKAHKEAEEDSERIRFELSY
jgi:hypothetical protein